MSKEEKKILVFGGTAEGRQVSDYLCSRRKCHTVCVATEYGEKVLSADPCRIIRQGRLGAQQMRDLLCREGFALVIDATHPYAVEVSGNIRAACEAAGVCRLRYLRPAADLPQADGEEGQVCTASGNCRIFYVNSAREAARYLQTQSGPVFLTTGSKELHVFTEEISDRSRLFARVLPTSDVLTSCSSLGLEGRQICGMQGPFSMELNRAMLRQWKAAFLVTKETGSSGGYLEKLEAAASLGVCCVVIRRPKEQGENWNSLKEKLDRFLDKQDAAVSFVPGLRFRLPASDGRSAVSALEWEHRRR